MFLYLISLLLCLISGVARGEGGGGSLPWVGGPLRGDWRPMFICKQIYIILYDFGKEFYCVYVYIYIKLFLISKGD